MDSSRNGLLSTILMTLPLIAVPAMALLRPPGQAGVSSKPLEAQEESTDDFLMDADSEDPSAEDDELLFEEEPAPKRKSPATKRGREKKPASPNFDDIFDNGVSDEPERKASLPDRRKNRSEPTADLDEDDTESLDPGLNDPFMDSPGNGSEKPDSGQLKNGKKSKPKDQDEDVSNDPADELPGSEEIVEQLTARGAVRTKWFEAGDRYPVGFAVYFRGQSDDERIRFEAVGQTRDECARDVLAQVDEWQKRREKKK